MKELEEAAALRVLPDPEDEALFVDFSSKSFNVRLVFISSSRLGLRPLVDVDLSLSLLLAAVVVSFPS